MWRMLGVSRVVLLLLVSFGAFYAYQYLWKNTSSPHEFRRLMAEQVCLPAALAIPLPPGRPTVAVAQAHGDFQGIVTLEMRKALAQRNATVTAISPWEDWLPQPIGATRESTIERSKDSARSWNIPYVVLCEVKNWVLVPIDEKDLTVQVTLLDVQQEVILFSKEFSMPGEQSGLENSFTNNLHADLPVRETSVQGVAIQIPKAKQPSSQQQLILFASWLMICIIAPWLGANFIGRALQSSSNFASMILIVGYLLLIVVAGWCTWGHYELTWLTMVILAVLIPPWLGYLEFVCRSIAERG